MELNSRAKKAISLIELLVSLSMTAILMLMLFGIVSKKTRDGIVHLDGVFYCWKDWNGNLYQKSTTESIQTVSSCKIKIPKDAKNIQVFIIGGGSGGYKFDKNSIKNTIKDNAYEQPEEEQLNCIKSDVSGIYTKMHITSDITGDFDVMTKCNGSNNPAGCKSNIKIQSSDYKSVSDIQESISSSSPFSKNFVKDLISKGYCFIPIYLDKSKKFIKSEQNMATEKLYYYTGSSKTGGCAGYCEKENANFEVTGGSDGICYQNGILKSENGTYYNADNSISDSENVNKLSYKYVKSKVNLGSFSESTPGDIKRGYAEAGREYTISADKIGNGGAAGSAGEPSQFGNLKASGGKFRTSVNTDVNLPASTIDSIKALNTAKSFTICQAAGVNCSGKISEQLVDIAAKGKIVVNKNTEIQPAKFEKEKWNESSNPQKSNDDIVKTGFGYFGASGSAIDCNVNYYPVKSLKYNDLDIKENSKEPKVDSCATLGHGMGGAIIIKWD